MRRGAGFVTPKELVSAVGDRLRLAANPRNAGPMQRYMKSTMPYLGITAPRLKALCRDIFTEFPLGSGADWRQTIQLLWRNATHREQRYAAIALADFKEYHSSETLAVLPRYREMIRTGAWWDYVDQLASHRIGSLLRKYPGVMKPILVRWARSTDLWLRRAAILAQLGFKGSTDGILLLACIEPSVGHPDFFLRKGIGWALRQYAREKPRTVIRYVERNRSRLSPLSKREALKALLRAGVVKRVP